MKVNHRLTLALDDMIDPCLIGRSAVLAAGDKIRSQQRFMKVVKAVKGAATGAAGGVLGGSSDSSAAVTKRLHSDLQGISPAEISRHESWYRLRGLHLAKKRAEKQVGRV